MGDNIFYGLNFSERLETVIKRTKLGKKGTIFGYAVTDPKRYGVIEFDQKGEALSIEEKPKKPKSNHAVVGLYYYPNSVVEVASKVKPSNRGELEITSVNQVYLERDELNVEIMSRGYAWLDTGTHESLTEATEFVKAVEKRTSLKIACIEEIAYRMGFISKNQLMNFAEEYKKNDYGRYLKGIYNQLS